MGFLLFQYLLVAVSSLPLEKVDLRHQSHARGDPCEEQHAKCSVCVNDVSVGVWGWVKTIHYKGCYWDASAGKCQVIVEQLGGVSWGSPPEYDRHPSNKNHIFDSKCCEKQALMDREDESMFELKVDEKIAEHLEFNNEVEWMVSQKEPFAVVLVDVYDDSILEGQCGWKKTYGAYLSDVLHQVIQMDNVNVFEVYVKSQEENSPGGKDDRYHMREAKRELERQKRWHTVPKGAGGGIGRAPSYPEVKDWLQTQHIKTILIAGYDAHYCLADSVFGDNGKSRMDSTIVKAKDWEDKLNSLKQGLVKELITPEIYDIEVEKVEEAKKSARGKFGLSALSSFQTGLLEDGFVVVSSIRMLQSDLGTPLASYWHKPPKFYEVTNL